jgi:hypothetical protein
VVETAGRQELRRSLAAGIGSRIRNGGRVHRGNLHRLRFAARARRPKEEHASYPEATGSVKANPRDARSQSSWLFIRKAIPRLVSWKARRKVRARADVLAAG